MKKSNEYEKFSIKALIFDIGGVLFLAKDNGRDKHLLSSFKEACLLLKDLGVDVSESQKVLSIIYQQSSRGDISKEETLDLMSTELNISPEKLEELFKKVYLNNTIENENLYNYVLELKKGGYKIGILSTQFHLSKDILIPNKYYENFDALEISCDDGLKKPDEKAFELIIQRLEVKPEESIFIDDKQENLDVVEKLGMKTVLFENNKQFFLCLRELGIKNKISITTEAIPQGFCK